MNFFIPVFVVALLAVAGADVVQYRPCSGDNTTRHCSIKELRVSPCPEASNNKPCNIKRGNQAEIEFDYEGKENVDGLTTRAYWSSAAGDLPLVGMDTDGCKHTQCPTGSGVQTFKYTLEMSKKFPARGYDVKWRLYKDEEIDCCLIFKIKLEK